MRTNVLNQGMKYSLMLVMFFITYAMAFAQPDPDSSSNYRNRMLKFTIESNQKFAADYSFLIGYLVLEGVDITNADFEYQLLLESPLGIQTLIPNDITINEDGIVNWTPTAVGKYYFGVRLSISDIPEESIVIGNLITVTPTAAQRCATIAGQVSIPTNLDSNNIYLPGYKTLKVMAIPTNNIIEPYYADVLANGKYKIKVPKGYYKLAFSYNNGIKYYPNTTNFNDAETIILACGDSVEANMNISAQDFPEIIYFTTYPPFNVELNVNEVYNYQANAVSTLKHQVLYRIYNENADPSVTATIDANTGMTSFSASQPGRHYVQLEAYIIGDSIAGVKQIFEFMVRDEEPIDPTLCAIITGKVSGANTPGDSSIVNGGPVGIVHAMHVMNDSSQSDPNWNKRSYSGEVAPNGFYSIHVPAGSYKLYFSLDGSIPEFYNNAYDYEAAETISIACGDSRTINAELEAYAPPTNYRITGRVFDEATNKGVRATIYLFLDDCYIEPPFSKLMVKEVNTNPDGTYFIDFPEGYSFHIYAEPFRGNYYLGEFYNNTYNVEEAELMTLTANRSGVDFGLARANQEPVSKLHITGNVKDQVGNPVLAMVTLIRKPGENESDNNYTFANVSTDTLGYYDFTNLRAGKYILFAMPINRPLLPGFYVSSGLATWNWEEASEIIVTGNEQDKIFFVCTISLPNIIDTLGLGKVVGKIEQSLGKIATFAKLGNGSGISGVMVTAYDANSVPVKYVYTNENGEFTFDKLGFGDFTLKASKIGYGTKSTVVTIDAQNLTTNSNIYMDTKSNEPTSVDESVKSEISIYPNPVQNSTTLSFDGNEGNATITISDMQGREMITINKSLVNGANSVVIDASELNSGLYLVKVRNTNSNIQTLMNVVK